MSSWRSCRDRYGIGAAKTRYWDWGSCSDRQWTGTDEPQFLNVFNVFDCNEAEKFYSTEPLECDTIVVHITHCTIVQECWNKWEGVRITISGIKL